LDPVQSYLLCHPAVGILTHIKLKVHKKEDHPDARGLNIVVPYEKAACQALLEEIAKSAADKHLAADYDFTLTVISNDPCRPREPLEDDGYSGPAPRSMTRSAASAPIAEGGAQEDGVPDITSALRAFNYSPEDVLEFKKVGTCERGR
jgi:hypothetical protein